MPPDPSTHAFPPGTAQEAGGGRGRPSPAAGGGAPRAPRARPAAREAGRPPGAPALLLCALALLASAAWAGAASATGAREDGDRGFGTPRWHDYREIPGVTREDIEAIERLKRERSFLVYGSCRSTEAFNAYDGQKRGFSSHMASWLTELLGIDVQLRIFEWDEFVSALKNGDVDFTGDLTPTPERRRELFMTQPIAERGLTFFRLRGSPPLAEIARERRLRFAFLEDTVTPMDVASTGAWDFEAVGAADFESAYALLADGRADAFLHEAPAEAVIDSRRDVVAQVFYPVLFSEVSLSARSPANRAVIDVVDKAIAAGALEELLAMYIEGEAEYRRHQYTLRLAPGELRFLQQRQSSGDPILFGAEHENYPISFWNGEEGEFQGIAIDILKQVSAISGLSFRPANDAPVEWPELLRMLEEGEATMVTELIPTPERAGRFLWAEPPFSVDKFALISRNDTRQLTTNEIHAMRVGLIKDSAWADAFLSWFRNHPNVREYISSDLGFDALERGEIDLLMGSRNLVLGESNYRERPGFKVNLTFETAFESSFGLNIHETMVQSLLSKAITLVDCDSVTDQWLRRSFDYRGKLARSRVPWLAGLAALLVLLLALSIAFVRRKSYESRRLEAVVGERTAELNERREEALRQLKAKGDFLARMSHEIRTPMNAIIGMAELALRERLPDEASEMITNILRAGNSLLTIINDILDFSKIESGRMEIVSAPYRLGALVQDAVGIATTRLSGKPVEFLVEVDPRLPAGLVGDEVRIRQVILNLLSNAVKYTRKGWVRLRIEWEDPADAAPASPQGASCPWPPRRPPGDGAPGRPARGGGPAGAAPAPLPGPSCTWPPRRPPGEGGTTGAAPGARAAGPWDGPPGGGGGDAAPDILLRIVIADSGIGIREEDMDRLFGTFAQVDKETNRGIEGTGLGLAITRNLASLMGGKIKVESEYGQGSVFTAEIPQLAPEPREPLAALNEPARNRSLFLEPDPLRAESLEWTLVRLGARYEIASGLDDFASALRGADGFAYFFAPEEEELAATAIATRAGTRIRPVWLSPPGAKGCRNPGALGSPFPLWCLPVARILNGEAGAGSHQARDRTEAAGLTAPSARVLLVDDLTVNLKVARGLLKPFQVEVDTCESGSEAVRLASEILYDIIFMDHVMPGMDGIEATERIRAAGNRVPVIALTANAVSGMREMFLCHGMNDFISKPIEIGRLEGILRQWLPPAKIVEPSAAPPPVAQAAPSPASAPAAAPAGRAAGPAPARGDHTAPGAAPPPAPADGGAGGRPGRDGGFDPAQSLSQLGGDQELLLEVLEMYVSSTPALLDRLRGIGPGEVVDSAKVFHSIKGSSLNVGARMVGEMAAALERAAKEGDGAAVLDGCQEFIETVEGLIWQMASFLRQATPGLQDPAVPEGH